MKKYAPFILRLALSFVLLWFAYNQLTHTSMWIRLLPGWTNMFGLRPETLIHMNAWFEIIVGLALLVGFYTRLAGLLISLHIFHIAYVLGYGAVAVRDIGLALAALSIACAETGGFSVDMYLANKKQAGV